MVPTKLADKKKLMNLEKVYDLDAVWSELTPGIRDQFLVFTHFFQCNFSNEFKLSCVLRECQADT